MSKPYSSALRIHPLQKTKVHMIRVVFHWMNSSLSSSPRLIGLRIRKAFFIRYGLVWNCFLSQLVYPCLSILSAFQITRVAQKIAPQSRPERTLTPWYIITRSERLNVWKKTHINFFFKSSLTIFSFLGDDILVYQDEKNPTWMFGVKVTDDGKYLVMSLYKDCSEKNLLWIADLESNNIGPNIQWIKLVNEFEADYEVYVSQCLSN